MKKENNTLHDKENLNLVASIIVRNGRSGVLKKADRQRTTSNRAI